MSESLTQLLHDEHQKCDQAMASAEEAALSGDLAQAQGPVEACIHENIRHFKIEEDLLFPAFEEATGTQGGPTQMMRMEHDQMRGLLEQMESALKQGDLDRIPNITETLVILMQQHNMKEENILYPMMDQVLHEQRAGLIKELKAFP